MTSRPQNCSRALMEQGRFGGPRSSRFRLDHRFSRGKGSGVELVRELTASRRLRLAAVTAFELRVAQFRMGQESRSRPVRVPSEAHRLRNRLNVWWRPPGAQGR